MPQTDWTFEHVRRAPKQLRQKIRVTHCWQVCILYDDDLPGIFGMAGGRSGKCLIAWWVPPQIHQLGACPSTSDTSEGPWDSVGLKVDGLDISVPVAISKSVDPTQLACERCFNMFAVFRLCQSSAWRTQFSTTFAPSGFHTCDRCTRWKRWQ